jgi:hypothetical protein
MADQTGEQDIRNENIARAVDGFGLQAFKMRQFCKVVKSSAWKESYYQETSAELTAKGETFNVKGVAELAAFPNLEPTWTLVSSYTQKHAGEHSFSWRDNMASEIDVRARVLLRIARAIAYSEDLAIYDVVTADANVNTAAAVAPWDSAVVADRDPVQDILSGIELCGIDNYDVLENGFLVMNYANHTHLMMNQKVLSHPTTNLGIMKDGKLNGRILGLKPLISNTVDSDEVAIIKGGEAVTYHVLEDLKAELLRDAGIKWTVRAWLYGKTQIKNPEAIHIITNTEA